MVEVKQVDLNRVGLTLARMYDPVAVRLEWKPLCRLRPFVQTHALTIMGGRALVQPTMGLWLEALSLGCVGAALLVHSVRGLIQNAGSPWQQAMALSLFLLSSIFILLALALFLGNRPLTFDKRRRIYYRGKGIPADAMPHRNRQGPLSEIHAVQVTGRPVHTPKGHVAHLRTYEINLVFRDGYRVNVLDDSDTDSVENAARELGEFLRVPVWSASY